ncbi:MAG TPA: DUF4365 domain-containing protein [Gemmataceae bacterium]|nr:DUF4365 domain-containing protein [Gemmataceae bacterium]
MAAQMFTPRKQRTRQHVIADLSINYVERIVLEAGHTAQRLTPDYGYDLVLFTYDELAFIEPGFVYVQVKASEILEASDSDYVFDLDIRDYNLWLLEEMPVILILFDASRRRAYWLFIQKYFSKDASRQPRQGAKTVRVHVPKRKPVTPKGVAAWRDFKRQALQRAKGEQS